MIRKRVHTRIREKMSGHGGASAPERVPLAEPHLHAADRRSRRRHAGLRITVRQEDRGKHYGGNVAAAKEIGKLIAERAKEKGIKKVVFDRGGYLYHGRVKALADAAREAGLEF